MIRIAITGGIACGKSLVGTLLAEKGWQVCETDHVVAHALYAPGGPAYDAVCDLFGSDILHADGSIDRKTLGQKVFSDASLLDALNKILHPLVEKRIAAWLRACAQDGAHGAAVIVPLLFEAGMEKGWDAVLCVGARPDVQRQRLLSRGLDDEAIAARIASQWPIEKKMALADYQIWNNGDRTSLAAALRDVIGRVSERKNDG